MTVMPSDEWFQLLASWSKELLSTIDRIHYLIGNRHQPTKGGYREALLRKFLRRLLPERFRVSTGFIYRWDQNPSRQLDILIWDAQQCSALLEEGELVVLTADSVAAIIEVKSTLNPTELRDALTLLHPEWLISWCHTSESSAKRLRQQVPIVPFRALFAYNDERTKANASVSYIFEELALFYRQQFVEDAERALKHTRSNYSWSNMIDAICIANGPQIEQTRLNIGCPDNSYQFPGFVAYGEHHIGENISVGRFCMQLLAQLTEFSENEATRITLRSPTPIMDKGICCFGQVPSNFHSLKLWGTEVNRKDLWCPDPPLWS